MVIVGLWFIIVWNAWNIFAAVILGVTQAKKNAAQGCATIVCQLLFSTICIVAAGFAIGAL